MFQNKISKLFIAAGLVSMVFVSCKKGEHIDNIIAPPEAARFNKTTPTGSFFIDPTNPATGLTFTVPVSISTVSSADRTLNLTYTSSTGAAQGVQYNGPASVTIPAGETTASFDITGIPAGYDVPGRKDNLVINISSPDTVYKRGTFWLTMQKYCAVNFPAFAGDYDNTNEVWGTNTWGPYTTAVETITSTGPTSARITVSNLFDFGWNPITFDVDWSNPSAFTVNVVPQSSGIGDAGTLSNGTYAGLEVAVRPFAGNPGTFSSCDGSITLRMQLGVAGVGWYGNLYQVTMVR